MAEVIVSSDGYLKQRIEAGKHVLIADEPLTAGGSDSGPDPYSLLLASLGACTAMTVQMYAQQKHWPLEKIVVRLHHARIHAEDCESCETKLGSIDRIQRQISLLGDLTEEQRTRLLEIARRCPVHRTLTSEVSIVDSAL
jgi:uncharacterized OsmC-like protein